MVAILGAMEMLATGMVVVPIQQPSAVAAESPSFLQSIFFSFFLQL
jgi:hypothetical protein